MQKSAAGFVAVSIPAILARCASTGLRSPGAGPAPGEAGGAFRDYGIADQDLGRVLGEATSRGADYAELFFQRAEANGLTLEDGQVNRASHNVDLGMGVRVVRGDRVGYAFTEDLTLTAMREAARTAAAISDGGDALAPPQGFGRGQVAAYYPVSEAWDTVPVARKLPILQKLDARIRALDPRVTKVTIHFSDNVSDILIARSDGQVFEDRQPMTTLRVSCLAEQDGRREEGLYRLGGRVGMELYDAETIEEVAQATIRNTMILFDAEAAPAGEMPVVLAAGSSGILLHEAIGHGMEADFNRKDISIYADRVNTKIAAPDVTIVDDGTNANMRGAINIDDEGEASEQTVLVEGGVLRTYMHDRISAAHYGLEPTGNGRRESFRFPPLPRMRNTYMRNGPHSRDELIASVKYGLLADTFTNGQVLIGAGDFTFYIKTGYLIEDGRLSHPVKDVNLIGNGPEVLEKVDMVGDDFALDDGTWTCGKGGQRVPVGLGMPSVRVASITVGGVNA